MYEARLKPAAARFEAWPLAVKSIGGFWALHLVHRTIIYGFDKNLQNLLDPAFVGAIAFGVAICLAMCAFLSAATRRSLTAGLVAAAILALPASFVFAAGELALYYHLSPEVNATGTRRTLADGTVVTQSTSGEVTWLRKGAKRPTVVKLSPVKERIRAGAAKTITANSTGWYFFFLGLGAFFVGMSSAGRLRDAERRAAEFERLAQSAQLRALRYQVNPHFLFNTLNSLSSLIMSRRVDEAEAMILSLSNFFRTTLAIDPTEDVTLSEEIALQRLYLDIEKARFPDRLRVEVDIADGLGGALVPALLLQPIVENAIKYGVAKARDRVVLTIRARSVKGRLHLVVENDGGAAASDDEHHGTGVGLPNVCQRLAARFGDAASCDYGPRAEGGFRVAMTMPLNADD